MPQRLHPEHNLKPTLSIIGAGKVGSTLARLWFKAGYEISAIYNRTPKKAVELADCVDAKAVDTLDAVFQSADIIFLTVADDAIFPIVNLLAEINLTRKAIVHTSGSASLDVLDNLSKNGAMLGSFHPAFPFADVESAIEALSGATFAIEANQLELRSQLETLAKALDGKTIFIPKGQKALYHAALVFISNYTVTLYAIAQNLLKPLSSDQEAIDSALMTLLQATVNNIAEQGIPKALTGPLVRSDVGTIQKHLDMLDDETLKLTYRSLARSSYPMLAQRGINSDLIEHLLQENE